MREEQILFVGKDSYQEPEIRADKLFLRQVIYEIKNIVETETSEIHCSSSKLQIELNIDDEDPNMTFRMVYPDYDLFPDELIKEVGSKVQEKLNIYLKEAYEINPNFYCALYPNWNGSYLAISLYIRPYRGTFKCPVCGKKVENSDDNSIDDMTSGDRNIAGCFADSHKTFFVKDIINQELKTSAYRKISGHLALHVIRLNKKEHLRLASQLNLIARSEDSSFQRIFLDKNNSKMYVITEKGIPAGYIYWNDFSGKKRCLRQLFIRDKFRRKGFGTLLLEKTVEIESKNEKFVVESPNKKSVGILLKKEYVKKEGDNLVGVRCSFHYGM